MDTHIIFTSVFNVKRAEPIIDPTNPLSLEKFKADVNDDKINHPNLKRFRFEADSTLIRMGMGYFIGIVTIDEDRSNDPGLGTKTVSILTEIFSEIGTRTADPQLPNQTKAMFYYRAWKLTSDVSDKDFDNIMSTVTKEGPGAVDFVELEPDEEYPPNDERFANLELNDSDGNEIIVQPHFANGSGGKD